ncbi:protease modulator HflC [Sutterella massiliensis]|uniref:Protein HflC n=1 Tax=Sutterella massiliensis TaxID=1816689 RepID=A0ABS2DQD8_9BURK|nr:protease modulator HflC [Sutterella massiliensis]MBM6703494.1 protease modulator HflC [Sutterella massiliensis]
MKRLTSAIVGLAVIAGLGELCLYTVNEREYAMVFALGELKTVVDEPGIHVKLPPPLQNVVYLDKRILTLDASGADLVQTSEKKNLMIDTFVKWRIGDPRLYWVSFQGSERAASDRLSALLRDVLNIAVNKRTVNQITSSEREKAMSEISELLQARVRDVGIDIVDVRMKRVDFTPEISESVYRRMEAERKRVASEERSKGAAEAERIRANADRQSEVILAQAYRDAQKTKGEGDAEAARIYADAFGKDPEFARFYRSLEAYRKSFAQKNDVMVVDPSADFFDYLKSDKPDAARDAHRVKGTAQ